MDSKIFVFDEIYAFLRSSFVERGKYHKSELEETETAPMCDKETVHLSNGLFSNRRASTSLLPSSTEVRQTNYGVPNGYSPSRRSVQSYRPPSQNSFKSHINHSMTNTFLEFPSKDLVSLRKRYPKLYQDYSKI